MSKKISDVITEATEILTKFDDDDWKNDKFTPDSYHTQSYENLRVEACNDVVICYENDIPIALFYCYELTNLSLNGARGLLRASGHETDHEFWFDNNEYTCDYTR